MLHKNLSINSEEGAGLIEYIMIRFFSVKSQKGVTMIEYALIAALIAVVAIVALTTVGYNLSTLFNTIASHLH